MNLITRELRRFRRDTAIPRGWRIVDYRDYKNIAVIAPVGIHWVVKAWNWLYERIEYQWCLKLEADLLESVRFTRSPLLPFCIEILADGIAQRRGYGLCWGWETEKDVVVNGYRADFGRVIAPIGLNLVYAFWRWLKFQ